jgi:hypothetical protein
MGSGQFGVLLKNELVRWAKLVQATNIKVD